MLDICRAGGSSYDFLQDGWCMLKKNRIEHMKWLLYRVLLYICSVPESHSLSSVSGSIIQSESYFTYSLGTMHENIVAAKTTGRENSPRTL